MKTIFLLFITTIMLLSCNNKFDNSDLDSIADHTIKYILKKDVESIKQMAAQLPNESDTLVRLIFKSRFSELDNITNAIDIKFIKYNIVNKTVESSGQYYSIPEIEFFFLIDKDYYQIIGTLFKEDAKFHYTHFDLNNLTYYCDLLKSENYVPARTIIDKAYWSVSRDGRTLLKFNVRGTNNTSSNIEKIKFSLELKDSNGIPFFKKTIVYNNVNLFPNDTFDIPIPELNNYHAGFVLTKDTFSFNAEVLSISPTPYEDSCNLLQDLK